MSDEGRQKPLTVQELLDAKGTALALEALTRHDGLGRRFGDADLSSPGLALAGYTRRFPEGRAQVFGETEMTYLDALGEEEGRLRLESLFAYHIPVVFVTKGQSVPAYFVETAEEAGIPVLLSRLSTKDFYLRVKPFLEMMLAPYTTLHGSLADVYGVGLLFVGRSGVGKSECVLDLIERGHRLVADDLVVCSRRGNDVLIGRGHELQHHHMEIRGVGIIDVRALFGIRAIRQQKRMEVVVHLEHWDDKRDYGRTGLDEDEASILGVKIPRITVPLNPGKNITVISEVVAMNHLLKYSGLHSAQAFDDHIRGSMRSVHEYLEQDYE